MRATQFLRHTAAAVTVLLLGAASVSAYVLLSPRRTWPSKPTYTVDNRGIGSIADGDGGVTRTVNAIVSAAAWNGAGATASPLVDARAGSVAGWQLGDGNPMLNFRDPENICIGQNCLAATFVSYYTGKAITDADIVTNSTEFQWTSQGEDPNGAGCFSEYYIEGVQVHEIGHGLGLGHTNVAGATMLPAVGTCNNNAATTEADDEAGIRDLYNCRPYGTVCDRRYVPPLPCCGNLNCYSPYPGVPSYCL